MGQGGQAADFGGVPKEARPQKILKQTWSLLGASICPTIKVGAFRAHQFALPALFESARYFRSIPLARLGFAIHPLGFECRVPLRPDTPMASPGWKLAGTRIDQSDGTSLFS